MRKAKDWILEHFDYIDNFIDYVFKVFVTSAIIYFLMII